ncbi:MAG TPA: hypothetical protein VHI11_01070 [Jiangellaceae bacterium]|nr:hypothetical protein [Jiangellaceae bacterium]
MSQAVRSEAELLAIQEELRPTPGLLGSASNGITGVVEIDVIVDNGTLQQQFDETYGEGVVRVTSVLQPVD